MFLFNRKPAERRVVPVRSAAIEGLEVRCLLSGSPGGSGNPNSNSSPGGPPITVPQNPNSGKNAVTDVKGLVTSVDVTNNKITVAEEHNGPTVTFTIPASASVTVKDTTGGLAAIQTGAQIEIQLSSTGTVLTVSAENPKTPDPNENEANEVEGTVSAVDTVNSKLSIIPEHGTTPTVLTIPTTAKITLNGKPATLADIALGSKVEVHFAADGITILSVEVTAPVAV